LNLFGNTSIPFSFHKSTIPKQGLFLRLVLWFAGHLLPRRHEMLAEHLMLRHKNKFFTQDRWSHQRAPTFVGLLVPIQLSDVLRFLQQCFTADQYRVKLRGQVRLNATAQQMHVSRYVRESTPTALPARIGI
jgi:hypothetical protein